MAVLGYAMDPRHVIDVRFFGDGFSARLLGRCDGWGPIWGTPSGPVSPTGREFAARLLRGGQGEMVGCGGVPELSLRKGLPGERDINVIPASGAWLKFDPPDVQDFLNGGFQGFEDTNAGPFSVIAVHGF